MKTTYSELIYQRKIHIIGYNSLQYLTASHRGHAMRATMSRIITVAMTDSMLDQSITCTY